ncbi:MAG TPA: copper homeostasis periplasmic binding protein CopC [Pseudolabrys sp.]|jgi:methionine-rich copper-binding protein CopC
MAIRQAIAAAIAGLMVMPVAVLAHAQLDHASPRVGSTVAQPPKEVSIWFTEALEPKFSTIEVRDAQGSAVHAGPAVLARDNSAQLRVPLRPLKPGTYKVMWRVLSVDTHRTEGAFTFRVGP